MLNLTTYFDNTGCPKKELTELVGHVGRPDLWAKVAQSIQSSAKWSKVAKMPQTVQYNLDGLQWSKNLVFQHRPYNSGRNFFGHPVHICSMFETCSVK